MIIIYLVLKSCKSFTTKIIKFKFYEDYHAQRDHLTVKEPESSRRRPLLRLRLHAGAAEEVQSGVLAGPKKTPEAQEEENQGISQREDEEATHAQEDHDLDHSQAFWRVQRPDESGARKDLRHSSVSAAGLEYGEAGRETLPVKRPSESP